MFNDKIIPFCNLPIFGILVLNPVSSNLLRPSRALQQIATHLLIIIVDNLLTLKGTVS
jgi:hypothetical protein